MFSWSVKLVPRVKIDQVLSIKSILVAPISTYGLSISFQKIPVKLKSRTVKTNFAPLEAMNKISVSEIQLNAYNIFVFDLSTNKYLCLERQRQTRTNIDAHAFGRTCWNQINAVN